MESNRFPIPAQRNYEYALNEAYQIATEKLRAADIQKVCQRSSAEYLETPGKKTVALKYLNQTCRITLPEVEFLTRDTGEELPIRERLIILHYLTWAKGSPLTKHLISLKELPEARNYFRTYSKRTLKPLTDHFGKEPTKLTQVAPKLGGGKIDLGDASVTIATLPRVPITLVLWHGDNEFPSQANILFDESISDYLPTEDIIVLTEIVVWKLVRLAKQNRRGQSPADTSITSLV